MLVALFCLRNRAINFKRQSPPQKYLLPALPLDSMAALNRPEVEGSVVDSPIILSFEAQNVNSSKCPFDDSVISFVLHPSSCVHLAGMSGAGKSTIANLIAGILPRGKSMLRETRGIDVTQCEWDPSIPVGERVGMLFQQTTLLDSLTVAGNVLVALENCPSSLAVRGDNDINISNKRRMAVKGLLETVGLNYLRDGNKRPSQLSGGMARRASLALQLAQHKRVIILDEPFAGLDHATGVGVARELERLRRERGTALLLISHEPELVDIVMGRTTTTPTIVKELEKSISATTTVKIENIDINSLCRTVSMTRREIDCSNISNKAALREPSTFGKDAHQRFCIKLVDYFLFSLPLIFLTFLAAGLSISMLSADILRRVDVTDMVLSLVQKEIKPIIQMFTGEEDVNPMYAMMINMKVRHMLNETMPPAKARLYAIGMSKLFMLEIGPLITALLLSGRIGGSYAGEVAMMQATAQNKLLQTLGMSPIRWTFYPSLLAGLIASPLLTLSGTMLALEVASHVGPLYDIGNVASYWQEVRESLLMPLRLRAVVTWRESYGWDQSFINSVSSYLDLRSTFSDKLLDAIIEIVTHPICFHLIKSTVFMTIIMGVAEVSARRDADLTPKDVPRTITTSVVGGSLLVIFADWGFSQLLLKRHP